MKDEVSKKIAEVDALVKELTGVDLKKRDLELGALRKVFQVLNLNAVVTTDGVMLVKHRSYKLVH
jgi:hypothetical protein